MVSKSWLFGESFAKFVSGPLTRHRPSHTRRFARSTAEAASKRAEAASRPILNRLHPSARSRPAKQPRASFHHTAVAATGACGGCKHIPTFTFLNQKPTVSQQRSTRQHSGQDRKQRWRRPTILRQSTLRPSWPSTRYGIALVCCFRAISADSCSPLTQHQAFLTPSVPSVPAS